ncbi:MAG: hypothetical protein AAGG01_12395 [Planctomycetota bacterium]
MLFPRTLRPLAMIRLSAPALLGVVAASAAAGFAFGWIAGPAATPVAASESFMLPATMAAAAAEESQTGGLADGSSASLASVDARANDARDRGHRSASDPLTRTPHEVPESFLNRAVRRVEAPDVEIPRGTAIVRGRVTTREGDPMPGVEVVATPAQPNVRASRPGTDARGNRARLDLEEVLEKAAKDWARGQGRSVTTRTGADGGFQIEGLADLSYLIRAQGEGLHFTVRENGLLNPVRSPDARVLLEAEPLQRIEVRVVGVDGAPVDEAIVLAAGERLEWTSEEPYLYVQSKQFNVRAMAEPFAIGVGRSATRLSSDQVPVDVIADPDKVITLELRAACSVSGRIVGERVTTESWQSIYAVPLRPDEAFDDTLPAPDEIDTNARQDVFLFADLQPGRYAICLVGAGGIPVDHEIVEVGPGLTEITLEREVYDPSKYIAVRALSPRGTAVESFWARFEYQETGSEVDSDWMRSRALPDGTKLLDVTEFDEFDYDAWPAGAKAWIVGSSEVYGQVRVPVTSGQREVTVQFEEPCQLTVQLEGEIGMGGFVVKVMDAGTEHTEPPQITQATQRASRGRPRIDASGRVHFRALSPGPVIVTLSQANYWWGEGNEIARAELTLSGADHQVSLDVPPVSDLEVLLIPCDERHYLELVTTDEDGEEHEVASTQTTEDGRAIFRGLPPGEYEIQDGKTGAKVKAMVPGPEVRIDLEEHVTKLTVSVNKLDGKLAEWGLAGGDLIVAIDGMKIEDRSMLMDLMHKDEVTVTVERGEETLELTLPRYPRETRDGNPLGGWIYIDS